MRSIFLIINFIILYVPVLVIFAITPYVTRNTYSFGVSIPEEVYENKEVRKIRNEYRNRFLLWGSIFSIVIFIITQFVNEGIAVFLASTGIIVLMCLAFIFYYVAHKKMKSLKEQEKWTMDRKQHIVVDTEFRKQKFTVSPWWFLLYPIIIIITTLIGILMFEKVPDRIPMQYSMDGEVTRWVDKSFGVMMFAPLMQVSISVIMIFVYWIIKKAKQQIDVSNPQKSIQQNKIFRYKWSAFTIITGISTLLLFTFMQLTFVQIITGTTAIILAPIIFTAVIITMSVYLSIKTGQGGSRINLGTNKNEDFINRDDDSNWKLGLFYYNPDDPAVFVEKRFGVGWTNNFARPLSWIMLIGLFLLFGIIIFISSKLTG